MNIAVLAGGTSTEREVSISTSVNVCKALRRLGHKANITDVFYGSNIYSTEAEFFEEENDLDRLREELLQKTAQVPETLKKRRQKKESFFGPGVLDICQKADIVFMGLHGENGENGKIQAVFDLLNIKYTGPGYLSSAISMDKALTKKILMPEGIPMPAGISLTRSDRPDEKCLPLPCVVKPACGGSSVGVTIANTEKERQDAISEAFKLEEKILIEEYVKGREFSVGVCEGKALPVVEIIPEGGVYDYKHKYDPNGAKEICPAQLPQEKTKQMQEYAEKICRILDIKTYSRIDQLMNENGEIYCLEVNTLPGMTPTSLLPKEAAAQGLSYDELVQKLIDISLKECKL